MDCDTLRINLITHLIPFNWARNRAASHFRQLLVQARKCFRIQKSHMDKRRSLQSFTCLLFTFSTPYMKFIWAISVLMNCSNLYYVNNGCIFQYLTRSASFAFIHCVLNIHSGTSSSQISMYYFSFLFDSKFKKCFNVCGAVICKRARAFAVHF